MNHTQHRLVTLCKLWGMVKLFHPALAWRAIDWDGALVAAIPAVKAATSPRAFAEAVSSMLAVLNDPATCVTAAGPPAAPDAGAASVQRLPPARLLDDGILLTTLASGNSGAMQGDLDAIAARLPEATAVVFDLRRAAPAEDADWLAWHFDEAMAVWLCSEAVAAPGERTRLHLGHPAQDIGSTGYCSAFTVRDARRFAAAASARKLPVVFLVNTCSALPSLALALQDAGLAAIVAEDTCSDVHLVQCHGFALDDGWSAHIRLGELLHTDGTVGIAANITVAPVVGGTADAPLDAALALARNFAPPPPVRERPPVIATPVPESDYAAMTCPPLEYRLLALFRLHTVIDYFFPYKDLMDGDWDALLPAFIPRFEAAADALDYHLAVAELLTHTCDSHVTMRSAVMRTYFGDAAPPEFLRWIEGAAVVTALLDAEAANPAAVAVGDAVLAVDGKPVAGRMARLGAYVAASTPQAHRRQVLRRLLCGAEGSEVRLTVRGADGAEREARLRRTLPAASQIAEPRGGDVLRWLPGNIGYADLDRLQRSEVDGMFNMFAAANAIVFDMRGYPAGTAWAIAPRLASPDRPHPPAARFERPRVAAPLTADGALHWQPGADVFLQSFPAASGPHYPGLTVMLIDERTASQAEHTGLFLRAANGTVFVGTPTSGTNGDITSLVLPGGIAVSFTGQAVLHPDGRSLQRVGLVPDVEAHPTTAGVREGRDEVLEAAIAYIQSAVASG